MNNNTDPFLVMLELIKGLNSKEAEAMIIKAMDINIEAAGLLSSRDTLLFLKPIYSELKDDFDSRLNALNIKITSLSDKDKELFDEFHSVIDKLTPNNGQQDNVL